MRLSGIEEFHTTLKNAQQYQHCQGHHQVEDQLRPCHCRAGFAREVHHLCREPAKKWKEQQDSERVEAEVGQCYMSRRSLHLDAGYQRGSCCYDVRTDED